jgi:hypothetical protein
VRRHSCARRQEWDCFPTAGSWTGLLVGYDFEMSANAFIALLDRRLGGGHVTERVQRHEIVDRAVVKNRVDVNARLFQFLGVGFALVAQWIVFLGRKALERPW